MKMLIISIIVLFACQVPVSAQTNSQDWVRTGDALFSQYRFQEAITAYDNALRLDPNNADALNKRQYAQQFAGQYNNIVGSIGSNYADLYVNLAGKGWDLLNAYRAVFAYKSGWDLGYYRGWHEGSLNYLDASNPGYANFKEGFDQNYRDWENAYKSYDWARDVWGMYQLGYMDGRLRGIDEGKRSPNTPILQNQVRLPTASNDFAQALRGEPCNDIEDPWCDLIFTNPRDSITGPLGGSV